MEWGMCSEWKKGQKPVFPDNPKAEFLNVYVSRIGVVICFAEASFETSFKNYELFVEANKFNPYFEWAAMFPKCLCVT